MAVGWGGAARSGQVASRRVACGGVAWCGIVVKPNRLTNVEVAGSYLTPSSLQPPLRKRHIRNQDRNLDRTILPVAKSPSLLSFTTEVFHVARILRASQPWRSGRHDGRRSSVPCAARCLSGAVASFSVPMAGHHHSSNGEPLDALTEAASHHRTVRCFCSAIHIQR